MISFGAEVRVFVATQPIDFAKAYMAWSRWWRRDWAASPTAATSPCSARSDRIA